VRRVGPVEVSHWNFVEWVGRVWIVGDDVGGWGKSRPVVTALNTPRLPWKITACYRHGLSHPCASNCGAYVKALCPCHPGLIGWIMAVSRGLMQLVVTRKLAAMYETRSPCVVGNRKWSVISRVLPTAADSVWGGLLPERFKVKDTKTNAIQRWTIKSPGTDEGEGIVDSHRAVRPDRDLQKRKGWLGLGPKIRSGSSWETQSPGFDTALFLSYDRLGAAGVTNNKLGLRGGSIAISFEV
jgi:hypothetical protein